MYERKWKVLADLLIELQKKGKKTPSDIMQDLKSAKTIIHVLKADSTHVESISRIENYLRNVEFYAISTAEKLGPETVQDWLEKLKEPIKEETGEKKEGSRAIFGVPRDKNWVRIQITEEAPLKKLQKLAKQNKLDCIIQENDHLVVYGEKNNIKSFVRSVAKQFGGSKTSKQGV
jgi:hypothetical protein